MKCDRCGKPDWMTVVLLPVIILGGEAQTWCLHCVERQRVATEAHDRAELTG